MSKSQKKVRQVLLIVQGSVKASRDKLRGVLKYARTHGPWRIHLIEGRIGEQSLFEIRRWGGTGIITESYNNLMEQAIIDAKLPTVLLDPLNNHLNSRHPFSRFCFVCCDGFAIGQMAAEHLLSLKCRHYAFVDEIHGVNWSCYRRDAFVQKLANAGFHVSVYGALSEKESFDWGIEQKHLVSWLQQLPKPVGIMAANDARGWQIIEACHVAGIDIPSEVAIISVDNDEMICETTDPPLSSIVTDGESGGYRAAEMLDALMRGAIRKQRIEYYGPLYVAQRRSTETIMIDDKIVARAVEFIRINSSVQISVAEVARHLKLSRRLLELRFKKVLGHTISDEIQSKRMDGVCKLLIGTDLRISEIAVLCGFHNEYYLCTVFKRRFGVTMSEFRSDYRSKIVPSDTSHFTGTIEG